VKKIISLFVRDYEGDRLVIPEIVEGAEWVVGGEGVATRKMDGTCCMILDGKFYKRYTLKKNRKRPDDFISATAIDEKTGKQEGWVPVSQDKAADQYHREAFHFLMGNTTPEDGTYELVGPKVQGNPEKFSEHRLLRHDQMDRYPSAPRTFEGLKAYFASTDIEGIVWHHPDGRMVKIKKKDFGMKR